MQTTVDVFVYGTLRTGEGLSGWLQGKQRTLATTRGNLYFARYHTGFPLARLNEDGTIIGELIEGVPYDEFLRCADMEEAAGYLTMSVPVDVEDRGRVHAYAFHYPGPVGAKIVTGDWFDQRATATGADVFNEAEERMVVLRRTFGDNSVKIERHIHRQEAAGKYTTDLADAMLDLL